MKCPWRDTRRPRDRLWLLQTVVQRLLRPLKPAYDRDVLFVIGIRAMYKNLPLIRHQLHFPEAEDQTDWHLLPVVTLACAWDLFIQGGLTVVGRAALVVRSNLQDASIDLDGQGLAFRL
jgi:hypothetical protein